VDNTPNHNQSAYSAQVSAQPQDTTPPAVPTGLGATAGDKSVALDWADNTEPDLAGYNVFRATTSGGPYTKINSALVTVSNYVDGTVSNFTTYYYVVTSVDNTPNHNQSAYSAQVSAQPQDTTPPAVPTGLVISSGDGAAYLDWADNNDLDLGGYNVYRATVSGGPYSKVNGTAITASNFTNSGLTNNTVYFYVVTAVDNTPNHNESAYSSEVKTTPVPTNAAVDGFESYTAGAAAMFRNPDFSGSTTGIQTGSSSVVSTEAANNRLDPNIGAPGSKSNKVSWTWTTPGSGYIRLTTYNTANRPNPLLKLNKGLSFYVKLTAGQLDLQIQIRETGGNGPIGANGGLTGAIERTTNKVRINASPDWQYVFIDIPNVAWASMTGNGVLEGEWGTLEALCISAVSGDPTASFTLYVDDVWQGPQHNPLDVTPPAAPTGLGATAGDGVVNLDWADNTEPDLAGYNVYRATVSGGPYTKINSALLAGNNYADNSVANFTTYYYVVTAVDNAASPNESANSAQVSAQPKDTTPPAAPTGLSATAGNNTVSLDWADNTEPDLAGYNIYRATVSGGPYTKINGSLATVSNYSDNTAANGVTYYYVVTAVDNTPLQNQSGYSAQVSATPAAPVLSYYAESDALSQSTSTSWQDKTTLTFTPSAGNFLIIATAEVNGSSESYNAKAQLTIDGTVYAMYDAEPSDTTNYQSFITHKVINLTAASHTIKIQYCSNNAAATARIRNARIIAFPVPTSYKDDDQDAQVNVTTTESTVASLTFSATAGRYLLIATAEPRPNSESYSIYTRFRVDGTIYDEDLLEGQDVTNYYTFGAMRVVDLTAGSHTFTITCLSESGTMYVRRPRIAVIPLSGFEHYYAESDGAWSTTSTSWQYKTLLDFTPSAQSNCLVFATARYKGSSVSYSPEVRLTIDSTIYGDCPFEPQDTTDYVTFASLKRLNLTAANHHIQIDYKSENAAATAYIKNARVVVIRF
ncbi:MAG TPA: hypothetical protein PKW18_02515, partial [Candidatus Sumerlaeota bacterium]|nr:hypothetical protein [Candidatus Sumerlaeota bacterium]HPL73432.1 hypothetical protein [Candidatus Sumerlaeota bacterium]